MGEIHYWLQEESSKNFGDYLTEYILKKIFRSEYCAIDSLHLIGSVIGPHYIDNYIGDGEKKRVAFWCCGLRNDEGLNLPQKNNCYFLGVRGPLTLRALQLHPSTAIGDPGLLLPTVFNCNELKNNGDKLLIPHILDDRGNKELINITGCNQILRPKIKNTMKAIDEFLERLLSADFALCGSLHAAIVRAAYYKPFAFWDSGNIDIPFKWQDFASSTNINCLFAKNLSEGEAFWLTNRQNLKVPPLWPMLAVSPLHVSGEIFIKAVKIDLDRHGYSILDKKVDYSQIEAYLNVTKGALSTDLKKFREAPNKPPSLKSEKKSFNLFKKIRKIFLSKE
jgi:hypothetical protein